MVPDQFRVWHADPDVHAFVGRISADLVAYGELWSDTSECEIELGRIIVDPTRRGFGVGRAFVKALVQAAVAFHPVNVFLRVLPANISAIRCYESVGFVFVSACDQATYNEGQPREYRWMKHLVS